MLAGVTMTETGGHTPKRMGGNWMGFTRWAGINALGKAMGTGAIGFFESAA